MESTVLFRKFEERDIDFIYKCKNDKSLNSMIVGQFRPFSYADAEDWVKGVIRADRKDMKFWAICANDNERKIVGWMSLSEIDFINHSACLHGIVIGDQDYRDGFAWIESYLFVFNYVFEQLKMNRLYGESILGHTQSNLLEDVLFFPREGIKRQALYKDEKYYDLSFAAILAEDYYYHKKSGDYDLTNIIKRIVNQRKINRKR